MATSLGELFVNITANTDDFDSGVKSVETKSNNAKSSLSTLSSSIKTMFVGLGLATVAKEIGEVAVASINAASEAEETSNKFNAVFSSIAGDAATMASDLADAYGLSQTASQSMLSATGDLLTGMGFAQDSALDLSKQVLELGTDLASFTNYSGGAEGASEALTKALLGERESLKSLGISISEAQVEAEVLRMTQEGMIFDTEAQADAQATLNLAMNQSINAIGDFERSQDSFANQTRIAKAAVEDLQTELGKMLLPAATSITSAFGELTSKIADFIAKRNELKEAEAALEAGTADTEQRILLMNEQIEQNDEVIEQLKTRLETETEMYGIADSIRERITQLEAQNTALATGVGVLKSEQQVRAELEAQTKADQEAEEKKAEVEAQAREARLQGYIDQNEAVQAILEANKSEIEQIDEQIGEITRLSLAESTYRDDQQEALEILLARKQEILDEEAASKQAQLEELWGDEEAFYAELDALAQESANNRVAIEKLSLEEISTATLDTLSTISDISDNLYQTQLNNIESETNAKIDALDEELLGEEAYSEAVGQLEYEAAMASWEIEKEQLKASKAAGLIEVAVNTAIGVSKALAQGGILGIATGALVTAAGVAQASAISSQPEPTEPEYDDYFAEGGVAVGATKAIVGEDGGEVMLGMGAAGSPLIDELSQRIANNIGGAGSVIVNLNGNGIFSQSDLDNFAEKIYNSTVKVQKRRGVI